MTIYPRHDEAVAYNGMSLRDYFAGQVIAMLVVHGAGQTVASDARTAYEVADAMMAQRLEQNP